MKGDREVKVFSSPPRLTTVKPPANLILPGSKKLELNAAYSAFKVDTEGDPTAHTTIRIVAKLTNLIGSVVFEVIEGEASLRATADPGQVFLDFTAMVSEVVTIKASVEDQSLYVDPDRPEGRTYSDSVTIFKVFDGLKGADGADGADGLDSKTVRIEANPQVVTYLADGTNPSSSFVSVSAEAKNLVPPVFFEFFVDDVLMQTGVSDTFTLASSATTSTALYTKKVEVQVREGSETASVVARDQITLSYIKAGSDGIAVVISNEAHTVSAYSNGVPTTLSGSGTSIEVWQGATKLSAAGGGGVGTFWVTVSGSGVVPGAVTHAGTSATVGDLLEFPSGNTSGSMVVTVAMVGTDGVARVLTKTVSYSKSIGGSVGDTGPRTATGFVYYQLPSPTAPGSPGLGSSSFNFSTGRFSSLPNNWSHQPPAFEAGNGNTYWYVSYSVSEGSYGGAQYVTQGAVSKGIWFQGLVTFSGSSTLSDGVNTFNYTLIDGGWIKTGKIDADRINVDGLTVKTLQSVGTNGSVIVGDANNAGYGRDSVYLLDSGGSVKGRLTHSGLELVGDGLQTGSVISGVTYNASTSGASFRNHSANTALFAATGTEALKTVGAVSPFTGAHEVLVEPSSTMSPGDILVDVEIVAKFGLSDCLSIAELSGAANQPHAIGVFTHRKVGVIPVAAYRDISGLPRDDLIEVLHRYDLVSVNSVGEGVINVCGENGNIQAGDLITTSSLPGKGQRQADDIVRSYTVARARESVEFSSPGEVRPVACIYLCG
jgi:hypothetical protein